MSRPENRPERRSNRHENRPDNQTARMFFTQNDVPDDDRRALVELLNQELADTTDLLTQTKYAHWNVKGMQFYQLHLLFDEFADVLFEHGDELGERVAALGGEARGTVRMTAENSRIPEIRTDVVIGPQYVEALANNVSIHAANLRGGIDAAEAHNDQDTADLLTELSREVDQYLWFLEAHLQREPIQPAMEERGGRSEGEQEQGHGERPQRYQQGTAPTRQQ
ncbi:starvation-inducible DNA-binding protein [Haladaptatus litoreus]|uniref:Starvation-inducible DNA-binding protein n=1 Tax=Haladaptatus litoreus TaxID=553468 RepID=A0A1N6ZQ59_9EURY|nr:DNA starvation/stationary phase protection protein Dps [Haladaptatus litoreus]SIR28861.1 starvation-inducible DNA-binding protein [Haladaptatus litoreus]